MVREPRAEPLLVVDTTWTDSNTKQHVHVPTLIDTGCNTSLLHSSMLNKLLSCRGKNLYVHELSQTISLTAATGDCLSVRKACTTDFVFQGQVVSHCMFIVDSLACDQKLLLGMDFLKQNNVRIDMETNTVTYLQDTQGHTHLSAQTQSFYNQNKQLLECLHSPQPIATLYIYLSVPLGICIRTTMYKMVLLFGMGYKPLNRMAFELG